MINIHKYIRTQDNINTHTYIYIDIYTQLHIQYFQLDCNMFALKSIQTHTKFNIFVNNFSCQFTNTFIHLHIYTDIYTYIQWRAEKKEQDKTTYNINTNTLDYLRIQAHRLRSHLLHLMTAVIMMKIMSIIMKIVV